MVDMVSAESSKPCTTTIAAEKLPNKTASTWGWESVYRFQHLFHQRSYWESVCFNTISPIKVFTDNLAMQWWYCLITRSDELEGMHWENVLREREGGSLANRWRGNASEAHNLLVNYTGYHWTEVVMYTSLITAVVVDVGFHVRRLKAMKMWLVKKRLYM